MRVCDWICKTGLVFLGPSDAIEMTTNADGGINITYRFQIKIIEVHHVISMS